MLHTTPQERLALGVVSLLLAAGAGARWLAAERAPPSAWIDSRGGAADTFSGSTAAPPRAAVEREVARERIRRTPLAPGERIDPNRASPEELERLPRVGPALAARIVAQREAKGPFRTMDDLDAVPGVGPAMLASLEPHLALAPAPARSAPPGAAVGAAGAAGAAGETPLELNRASAAELEALPGIGPALAGRIVEWRRVHGPFRSPDDLEEVPGIGPALRARLAPHLRFGAGPGVRER